MVSSWILHRRQWWRVCVGIIDSEYGGIVGMVKRRRKSTFPVLFLPKVIAERRMVIRIAPALGGLGGRRLAASNSQGSGGLLTSQDRNAIRED